MQLESEWYPGSMGLLYVILEAAVTSPTNTIAIAVRYISKGTDFEDIALVQLGEEYLGIVSKEEETK